MVPVTSEVWLSKSVWHEKHAKLSVRAACATQAHLWQFEEAWVSVLHFLPVQNLNIQHEVHGALERRLPFCVVSTPVGWQVSGELAAGSACCVTQGLLARGTDLVGWQRHRTGVLSMLRCATAALTLHPTRLTS